MSFTIFFPRQGDNDGTYTRLADEEDVYDVVLAEVRQSISDMGSYGYDLDLPAWPYTAECNGKTYHSTEEIEQDEDAHTEWTMLGHERGIDHATSMCAPEIFKALWVRYRTTEHGEHDIADNDTTYAKLPDGVTIALREIPED